MVSTYKQKLLKIGALDYLIHNEGNSSQVYFNKTRKEAKEEIRKMASYSSPRLYSRKKKKESRKVLVFDMANNCICAVGDMSDPIIKKDFQNPNRVIYYPVEK